MPTHAETCASAAFRLQQQQSHRKTARRADQIASEPHAHGARQTFTRPLSTSATLSEAYRLCGDVRRYCSSVPTSGRPVQDTGLYNAMASAPGMCRPRRRVHKLSSIVPALGDSCSTRGNVHGHRFALRRHTPAEESPAYTPAASKPHMRGSRRTSATFPVVSATLTSSYEPCGDMQEHCVLVSDHEALRRRGRLPEATASTPAMRTLWRCTRTHTPIVYTNPGEYKSRGDMRE